MQGFTNWFYQEQLPIFGQTVSPASVLAGITCICIGLLISALLQSAPIRRFFTRTGVDSDFSATVGAILGFLITIAGIAVGLHVAGIPISWNSEIPGIGLSILVVLRLLVVLTAVFGSRLFSNALFSGDISATAD